MSNSEDLTRLSDTELADRYDRKRKELEATKDVQDRRQLHSELTVLRAERERRYPPVTKPLDP